MDLIFIISVIVLVLIFVVIYQSRVDQPTLDIYFKRLFRLIGIILSYFKEIINCVYTKFKEINWNVRQEQD